MTPDDVMALRRIYDNPGNTIDAPEDTVLASHDWLAYVMAMADSLPTIDDGVVVPSEIDVRWAWPDGLLVVFDHVIEAKAMVLSHTDAYGVQTWLPTPAIETQLVRSVIIGPQITISTGVMPESGGRPEKEGPPAITHQTVWIGEDPNDLVSGYHHFGEVVKSPAPGTVGRADSWNVRFMIALTTALGHRLTTIVAPSGLSRPASKRLARRLPKLRVLELTSGAKVSSSATPGHVEWSRRWFVRGHWRDQPYGPGMSLRRLKWIDPYIKGPSDKPLDVRPTIWEADL